jgi:adenylate cyclase
VTIPNRDELGDLAQAFNAMTAGLRERGLYKQQLERYVSPQVAQKILSKPEKIFWAERKKVTVLFCDIRGFTSLAERLGAEQVVRRLNEFFYEMIDILFQYEGTLDKFIGDAIMALFGAPLSSGHDEEQAVSAAVAMQERTDRLNRDWVRQGFEGFRIGIAICTGEVVVGNIGSERRMEYSAIGDAVNMAWRLEELNKRYNTRILLSESTYQAVSDKVEVRPLGSEILRGRKEPVHIYELAGLKTSLITPS